MNVILAVACLLAGQWVEAPAPCRAYGSGTLGDIVSRVRSPGIYMDADPVTTAHECTHALNSEMRGLWGGNCFYVGKGVAAWLPEPRTTLAAVAVRVPADKRGKGYRLYLIEQRRYWNEQPLYILDELSAYLNGAMVALERGLAHRFRDSYGSSVEFCWYGKILMQTVPLDYDVAKLRDVLNYQIKRCHALRTEGVRRGWLN